MKKNIFYIILIILLFAVLIILGILFSKTNTNDNNVVILKSNSKNNILQINKLKADSINIESISDNYSAGLKIDNLFRNIKTELYIDSILLNNDDTNIILISPARVPEYLYRFVLISIDSINKNLNYQNVILTNLDSINLQLININDSLLINGNLFFNISDSLSQSKYIMNFNNAKTKIIKRWKGQATIEL